MSPSTPINRPRFKTSDTAHETNAETRSPDRRQKLPSPEFYARATPHYGVYNISRGRLARAIASPARAARICLRYLSLSRTKSSPIFFRPLCFPSVAGGGEGGEKVGLIKRARAA